MKKAYTFTPQQRQKNIKIMADARYKYGSDLTKAPEKVKAKCTKAASENATFTDLPENTMYLDNEVMYNLYLNRDTDEPITARELYVITETIFKAIWKAEDRAKTSAAYANWDGRP